jgi:hypothetical protein
MPLAPEIQDELHITVSYHNGTPSFHVSSRRVVFREGNIVLASPRPEELPIAQQYLHVMELAKTMGYTSMTEPPGGLALLDKLI